MNKEQRGSEKLMASCSGVTGLSPAEVEQVAGGMSITWQAFPHGVPWPELSYGSDLVYVGPKEPVAVDLETHLGLKDLRKPDYLYQRP